MKKILVVVSTVGLLSSIAFAGRGEFKQVIIAACEGKDIGQSCSFEGKRGVVEGICSQGKRNPNVLICKNPNRGKRKSGK